MLILVMYEIREAWSVLFQGLGRLTNCGPPHEYSEIPHSRCPESVTGRTKHNKLVHASTCSTSSVGVPTCTKY